MRPHRAQVEPRRGLHGVGVQHGAGSQSPHEGADRGEVGDRADLVVDGHHADDGHVRRRALRSSAARSTRPAASTATTVPPESLDGMQHGVVLGGRADGPSAAPRATDAGDRGVVGLGAAPGEHDLAGPAADDRGDDVAGLVDGPPGVAGEAVRTTRVGEALGEERQHRGDGVLAHRRRRRVVEVDQPVHGASTLTVLVARVVVWAERRARRANAEPGVEPPGGGLHPAVLRRRVRRRLRRVVRRADRRRGQSADVIVELARAVAGERRPRVLELADRNRATGHPDRRPRRRRRRHRHQPRHARPARCPRSRAHRHRRARRHGRRPARRAVRRRPRRLQLAVQPGDRGAPAGVLRRRRRRASRRAARSSSRRSCPRIRPVRGPSSPCARCRRARWCCRSPSTIPSSSGRSATSSRSSTATGCGCVRGPSATRRRASSTPRRRRRLRRRRSLGGLRPPPVRGHQSEARDGVRAEQVTLRNWAVRFAPDPTPRAYPELHCEPVASQPSHRAVGHDRGRAGEATERLRASGTGDRWRCRRDRAPSARDTKIRTCRALDTVEDEAGGWRMRVIPNLYPAFDGTRRVRRPPPRTGARHRRGQRHPRGVRLHARTTTAGSTSSTTRAPPS